MDKSHETRTAFGTNKVILLFLIISLAFLSGPAYAGGISSIDELVSAYSSESCIECHKDTHKGWKNSWHGRSVIDPRVLRTWRTFILRGLDKSYGSRRDLKDICLPCHAPQTKDASDELVTKIAGMIVTAVEEKDAYETEYEIIPEGTEDKAPPETEAEPAPYVPEDDIIITDIKEKDGTEKEVMITAPENFIPNSPWIRNEVDEAEDIIFEVVKEQFPNLIEDSPLEKAEDIPAEPVKGKVLAEDKVMVKDKDTKPESVDEFTTSFVEDIEIPVEPADDKTIEVENMMATIVVDNGKAKIEYSPYDPANDLKEPVFLDRGETLGEKAVKELSKLNISCMICHSMKALPGGNPRPKTIYSSGSSGSTEHKEALGAETMISDFMKTSEFCAQCHHGCPPGMPSSICPTLWTSYKEDYVARGGDKTCQDCHMSGADKNSHRFPGIYEKDHVKKGTVLTLDAKPTSYVYHLENRIVPAVFINVKVKNTAGHSIPQGCTYIPQTAMEVSVRDQNGNELFFKNKTYRAYNLHLPLNNEGYLGLNNWDITAMTRVNLGINPGNTDSNTYVVPLNEETTSVVIEASFKYIYEEGTSALIHKETKNIKFEIEKKIPRL